MGTGFVNGGSGEILLPPTKNTARSGAGFGLSDVREITFEYSVGKRYIASLCCARGENTGYMSGTTLATYFITEKSGVLRYAVSDGGGTCTLKLSDDRSQIICTFATGDYDVNRKFWFNAVISQLD